MFSFNDSNSLNCFDFKSESIVGCRKAQDGVRGAWFFHDIDGKIIVIKRQDNADAQIMGSIFMQQLGINSPNARLVEESSLEGKSISILADKYNINWKERTNFIIMDYVCGPNLGDLKPTSQDIELISNNLESLGRLAVFDLLLCNFDRLQLDGFGLNPGNIMFQEGNLTAIDTDCQAEEIFVSDQDRFKAAKLILKKMAQNKGSFDEKIIRIISKHFNETYNINLNLTHEKVTEGMEKAFDVLIKFCEYFDENKTIFIKNCKKSGLKMELFPPKLEELITDTVSVRKNFLREQK